MTDRKYKVAPMIRLEDAKETKSLAFFLAAL